MYHLKGSPVDPNRIYASQTSGWFGQIIQRSDDGGKTWNTPGSSPEELKSPGGMPKGESNKFVYEGEVGTHMWYDGTQHPWEFKRIWHIEPSLTDPDTAYAGAEDAAIFKTTDGGKTWKELPGLRERQRPSLATRRGRHGRAHDSARSEKCQAHLRRHLRRRLLSAPMTAAKPGSRSRRD